MTRVVHENPQTRPGIVKEASYRPERRELSATVRWSLESADARDEIRQTVDHKHYHTSLPRGREYVATIKWSLESSDAREEVREIRRSRSRKAFSLPERLPRHLDYLQPPQVTFDWGYGYFSPQSLRAHIISTAPSEPPPSPHDSDSPAVRTTDRSGFTLPPGPYDEAEPNLPLQALIGQAILSSKDRCLTLREISSYICTVYPFYSASSANDDAAWMKALCRKVNTSYFTIVPQDRSDKRKVNLYSIADRDLPCFANGGFEFRKRAPPKRKSTKALEVLLKAKKPRVSESFSPTPSPDDLEEDRPFFPPAPRSRTQSLSPPPPPVHVDDVPPRLSYQAFTLKPSTSLPALPFHPSKKLVPVHSWHQPTAYRTISPGYDHDHDSD